MTRRSFVGKGGLWVVGQVLLFIGFFWALLLAGEVPAGVRILGAFFAAVGTVLVLGGLGSLGPSLTPYPEPTRQGVLVRSGVYGLVRHPIYGGLAIGAIGLGLVFGSWSAVVLAVGILGFFRLKATAEEQRLVAVYPDYAGYRREVRAMLVPYLF